MYEFPRGERTLVKGNEAVAQGAIDAGCRYYFGYPITPQNEIPEYMALHLPKAGGVFLQAESEVAAINMVYGAAAAGKRAMTTSSSPGISLKQEGISYIAGAELPAVIVNVVRGGPGLGNIAPAQSDYFQAVKGGGHGDYRTLVLAPWSVQEMYDLTRLAFDIADRYRNPVMILADAVLGQMMEPMVLPTEVIDPAKLPDKPWATTGRHGGPKRIINSLYIVPEDLEKTNLRIQARYKAAEKEVRYERLGPEECDILLVAYGTAARICYTARKLGEEKGLKVGLLRPITLYPFPEKAIAEAAAKAKAVLTVELSYGQMVEDVARVVAGRAPVHFYGRSAGMVPTPEAVFAALEEVYANPRK
jgi:2-oxoglutarate/2-oxoacid ferredoxin oxidoreductase subunit alpha